MGHIDRGTGRNKRESGKLAARVTGRGRSGQIRRLVDGTGRPAERRIDQQRRNRTRGRGQQ
jgi:hypothetical protein